MKKAMRDKWVKALLSGKYEQGAGLLKEYERYCCLGVLCEVTGYKSYSFGVIKDRKYEYAILPQEVQHPLTVLNDDGVPFDMIAGLIATSL